jgi:OAA-family lectin sugar binding domain/SMI1 / KNR4 family (SUKH-1)
MEPIYADFSVDPARFGNVVVSHEGCATASSHLMFDAGGRVELRFAANGPRDTAQAVVTVTALVSKLGPRLGHAPISVLINGLPVLEDHVIPGGDLPADTAIAIPGEHLVAGTNVLRIQTSAQSATRLWLYRITVDTVENRGGAERALRRDTAQAGSVFAYRTERLALGAGTWADAPRVLVHIDRGEYAELSQLSWRDEDGAQASVSFQSSMSAFLGHHRAKDGTVSQIRGERVESWSAPEQVAPAAVHVFTTRESWGGSWHDSGELRLLLDDGGADVERVSWRDGAGNSGSVELRLPPPGRGGAGEITEQVTRVLASGENPGSGEVAANLLDDSVFSKWLTFSGAARLDFTLGGAAAVGCYELTSANDYEIRDPADWTLSGSPDGQTWTVLDTRSGESFAARRLSRVFRIRRSDQAAYRHYRLAISRSAGHAGELQLARVRFFGPAVAPALDFLGYYQRAGEGAIGYRGTSVAANTPLADRGAMRATRTIPGTPGIAATPGSRNSLAVPAKRGVSARRSSAVKATSATGMTRAKPPVSGKAAAEVASAPVAAPAAVPAPVPEKAATPVDPRLTTVEGWRAYLAEYGADVVHTMEDWQRGEFTEDQLSSGWLGGDPVDEARIAALEERLGKRLPASYRAFVGASDGWRHIGHFMYVMRGIDEIDWFSTADPQMVEIFDNGEEPGSIMERALLISKAGDAQYWFLDPEDVSPDGEWAAYTWSSWGFLSERYPSFAALVADERIQMERLRGYRGKPMHPEGADELLAEGRAQALRGDVHTALLTLDQAAIKGSGAAAYLKVILGIFLKSRHGHHELRNGVFGRPNVMAAVGLEQLRAEAVPLFVHLTQKDPHSSVPVYVGVMEDVLPLLPSEVAELSQGPETGDLDEEALRELLTVNRRRGQHLSIPERNEQRDRLLPRLAAFTPPVLPEPPAFQRALDEARALVRAGDPDGAWAVIEAALPGWHSDSPSRVAPVILLVDPVLNTLITPARSRRIVRVPHVKA